MRSAAHWLALAVACGGDDGGRTKDAAPPAHTAEPTPPPTGTTPTPDPCDTPLTLAPESPGVAPLRGTRFVATGGSGVVTFAFVENQSGGRLAERSGEYLAGPTTGVDTVRADDAACGGSAEASVEVLGELRVRPLLARVPPGSSFTIEVTGGSGSHHCEAVSLFAGALAGCTWTAGTAPGDDTLRVVDDATAEEVEVVYTVDPDAALDLWGDRLYVPVGVALAPPLRGGTGEYDLVPDDPSVGVADGVLTAGDAGRFQVEATDHFVPALTTSFPLEAVAFLTSPPERDGERMAWGQLVALDADGDGDDELLFGTPDVSLTAHDSGGAYLYDPSAGPAPVWSYGVAQQYAGTGRSVAAGDLNGDGAPDLVVGTDTWDESFVADHGRIDVFYGDGTGAYPAEPDVTLRGDAGDRLGHAVAVCDVDGDGVDDLIGSALQDDDPAAVGSYNQGSLTVWAGTVLGLDRVATGKVHATSPLGGVLQSDADALLGRRLAVGDRDGDGRCDAFASAHTTNLDGAGNDGVVWLFLADALLGSGRPDRVWTWTGADDNVQGGRNLAVGDLDGDGLDDLVIAALAADRGGSSRGAAFVFLAAGDDGRPVEQVVDFDEADVVIEGDDDGDQAAVSVAIADVTGDGSPDLVVGSQYDELDGGPYTLGTVRVFDDPLAARLQTTDAAGLAFPGVDVNDSFGTEVAVLDVDGDGQVELAAYASRADAEGIEAGAVSIVAVDGATTPLSFPGAAAGQHLGDKGTLAWLDLDGDGVTDPVGGAWGAPRGADGYDAGLVLGFTGGAPTTTLGGVPNHSAADRFGWGVDRAGDFDGDGRPDLVALMPYESRPSSFGAGFANPTDCAGSLSNAGAAWVFPGVAGGGVASTPSFVFYGVTASDRLETVAGGFDHDGDGRDDLAFGSTLDGPSSEGGVTIVRGRADTPAGTTVICAADEHLLGVSGSSRLGVAVAGVGDLDGDGCDELAAGADADDLGLSNQGSVRILWGHGPACASSAPEVTTLGPLAANTRAGTGVDGGLDVDGDGVPDVAVGGYDFEATAGVDVGAAWLLSGAWLATQPRQPAGTLPADTATTVVALPATARVVGDQRDAEFGAEVAVVRAPNGDAFLAAGSRWWASADGVQTGAVTLWDWSGGGFGGEPVAVILGEPGSQLGDALRRQPDRAGLLVGAPLSDAGGLDAGALLPIPVR